MEGKDTSARSQAYRATVAMNPVWNGGLCYSSLAGLIPFFQNCVTEINFSVREGGREGGGEEGD